MKAFFARLADRLSRSAGFFLTVLIVLCAVEVAVDWNATLYEINVLRAQLKQKAENYADLLRKAAEPSILAYDADELERLSAGLFEDEELVYVRFSDLLGNTLFDRLRPDFARAFAQGHHQTFRDHYRRPMTRDAAGIATDPALLKQKMERSRHRDFIQAFTDGENALFAKFSTPAAPATEAPRVLYQDRLADAGGNRDVDTSYSVGSIAAPDGEVYGVVLVAFRHDKLNHAVRGKLLKGLGMVVFFVGLILVQNLASRKSKLRLLDLEAAQKAARHAVRSMLPPLPSLPWGKVEVALEQADHVGGSIYDLRVVDGSLELLLAVPDGDGVEAAFASVALLGQYRRLSGAATPAERAAALLSAYDQAPLGKPMALMLLQIAPDGLVNGVTSGLPPPSLLDGEMRQIVAGEPLPMPSRFLSPPRPFSARLGTLILAPDPSRVVELLAKGNAAERAVAEDRRKQDALVVIVTRSAA